MKTLIASCALCIATLSASLAGANGRDQHHQAAGAAARPTTLTQVTPRLGIPLNHALEFHTGRVVVLKPLSSVDLTKLAQAASAKAGYTLEPAALDTLPAMLDKLRAARPGFGNARGVVGLVEKAYAQHAQRTARAPEAQKMLTAADFTNAAGSGSASKE